MDKMYTVMLSNRYSPEEDIPVGIINQDHYDAMKDVFEASKDHCCTRRYRAVPCEFNNLDSLVAIGVIEPHLVFTTKGITIAAKFGSAILDAKESKNILYRQFPTVDDLINKKVYQNIKIEYNHDKKEVLLEFAQRISDELKEAYERDVTDCLEQFNKLKYKLSDRKYPSIYCGDYSIPVFQITPRGYEIPKIAIESIEKN